MKLKVVGFQGESAELCFLPWDNADSSLLKQFGGAVFATKLFA
jgi:hypothetical protein